MSVRAKFRCYEVAKRESGGSPDGFSRQIKLSAVNRGDAGEGEDSTFGKWTPNGEISTLINNPAAAAQFEPGKAYYVDFTPAD